MGQNEFTVWWYDPDGNHHKELAHVDAKTGL